MAGNANSGGGNRKPVGTLKLHGTYRGDRHAQRFDDSALEADLVKPCDLDGDGEWLWDFIVDGLRQLGIKRIDTPHVWTACEMWSLYRTCMAAAKSDPVNKDLRIAVTSYRAAFESAASKIGLNPIDRARLRSQPETQDSEFDTDVARHA